MWEAALLWLCGWFKALSKCYSFCDIWHLLLHVCTCGSLQCNAVWKQVMILPWSKYEILCILLKKNKKKTVRIAKCCQLHNPAAIRALIPFVVTSQAAPVHFWGLWKQQRWCSEKASLSDIVGISVNSQGSRLVLEMAEDWKMWSEQYCLCRARAHF